MKTKSSFLAAFFLCGAVLASSHREAPAISYDPQADNTDVYAFVTQKTTPKDTLNIVASWIPFEEPSSGPNFFKWSDDVQYQIHIARGATSLADVVTYTIRFTTASIPRTDPAAVCATPGTVACVGGGKEFFSQLTNPANGGYIVQTYTVTKTTGTTSTDIVTNGIAAPWRIGPRTQATLNTVAPTVVTSATYDETYAETFIKTGTDGTRVFAGPRDDGFYVDVGGIFDLANLRAKGTARDVLAGYNVHSIAIEIPTTQLTSDGAAPGAAPSDANTLGIWASSSRKKVSIIRANGQTSTYGPWVQVSRLGLPLINEAVIGLQDKDKYNRTQPKDDVANFGAYFLNPVIVPDAEAVGIYAAMGITPDNTYRHNRTDILDVIGLATVGAGGALCSTYPTTKCHNITAIGDVLRIDLNLPTGFPNGRSIPGGAAANMEQADVTDVELSLLLGKIAALSANGPNGNPPLIQDGVDYNDKNYLDHFPWLALPWEGFGEGHGKTTP